MTTCLGKSCSFGLPRVPFVNCCQFMYLVISLLVLRAGCGIWLYLFLIIAYLLTFIFSQFLIIWDCWIQTSESRIPLKRVQGGSEDDVFSSISHEHTQSTRVCCFPTCRFTVFPKDPHSDYLLAVSIVLNVITIIWCKFATLLNN